MFTGADLLVGDGLVIEDATFVVRDDMIVATGTATDVDGDWLKPHSDP